MSLPEAESDPAGQQHQTQFPLALRTRSMASRLSRTTSPQRLMGRRKPAISARVWNQHRAKIEDMFLFQDKTLPEIMHFMAHTHNFHASKKMYKTQMKHWQLGKYLRTEQLLWMHWKADQRRQENAKDTEFLCQGQTYSSEMVQQRLARRRTQLPTTPPSDLSTPCGLDYATPIHAPASPDPIRHGSSDVDEEEESESDQIHSSVDGQNLSFNKTGNGSTAVAMLEIRHQAEKCEQDGDFDLAEKHYLEALSGLKLLLSGIHDETVTTAYCLATFYARRARMEDADRVLDRVTASHLKSYSAVHPRTAKHLFHVLNFFEEWSRADDRDVFALRVFESLSDHARAACDRLRSALAPAGHKTAEEIDQQLRRVMHRAESELRNAQIFIRELIGICDADIVRLGEQGLRCRIQLVSILHQRYTRERGRPNNEEDLAIAREFSQFLTSCEAFLKRLWRSEVKVTPSLIGSSIQLAKWFVRLHHYDQADYTFTLIAYQAHNYFMDAQDSTSLIVVLLYIGLLYQTEGRWDDARPHFEHALVICSQTEGHEDMSELLGEALQERILRVSKLPLAFRDGLVS